MTENKVVMTTTYYRDEAGEARIRHSVGSTILSDEPNCYFFVDTGEMLPWYELPGNEKGTVKQ